jgi:phenylpyruvate tautomerase PptA (4-oxalocrotonate tautomerase family)
MPLITIQYASGTLAKATQAQLAEDLTKTILEIEGIADTQESRALAWVRFQPIDGADWYLGGRSDSAYEAAAGRWLVELNVAEGALNQEQKSRCHQAITQVILHATGHEQTPQAARSIWIQIIEWPEGHLGAGGRTASMLGIAKLVKIPAEQLAFPRAYFAAKDRLFDLAGMPAGTAGRALVRDN